MWDRTCGPVPSFALTCVPWLRVMLCSVLYRWTKLFQGLRQCWLRLCRQWQTHIQNSCQFQERQTTSQGVRISPYLWVTVWTEMMSHQGLGTGFCCWQIRHLAVAAARLAWWTSPAVEPHVAPSLPWLLFLMFTHWTSAGVANDWGWLTLTGRVTPSAWLFSAFSMVGALWCLWCSSAWDTNTFTRLVYFCGQSACFYHTSCPQSF